MSKTMNHPHTWGVFNLSVNSIHTRIVSCTWWRHQMDTFYALLTICAGNSPVPGEFPTQRPVTRSFDVFFDLRPNRWLSKQWWDWWFETPSSPLWRHRNDLFEVFSATVVSCPHSVLRNGTGAWLSFIIVSFRAYFLIECKMYLHFLSLYHIEMAQKIEIIPCGRQGGCAYPTQPITCLLINWKQ